jgi:hypothetical protein
LLLMVKEDPALAMMMSLYATLGIFLLFASRNPSTQSELDCFHCVVELRARQCQWASG